MPEEPEASEAVKSSAQSRLPPDPPLPPDHGGGRSGASRGPESGQGQDARFEFGERLFKAQQHWPYRRKRTDPLYRRLSIYSLDPAVQKLDGAVAEVKVGYEELAPGPIGSIVEVVSYDDEKKSALPPADLDSLPVLLDNGYVPSMSSPQFRQQMVYAVAMLTYADFKLALGREVPWAIKGAAGRPTRLKLRPFGPENANAWYDRDSAEIVFGQFTAKSRTPVALPGRSKVYTSLSHDIIVHEVSHALLDGLRAHFFQPSHPDVLAFHEAFADLIAFFQHFSHPEVVRAALSRTGGGLAGASSLVSLAQEFGRAIGADGQAMRTLAFPAGDATAGVFDPEVMEPHERGQALTRAIFLAFDRIYNRRIRRIVRLATGGTGILPDGELPDLLLKYLVEEAGKVAAQFQSICIRAIDYCPPVDVRFGDYLRAMITADADLVPDDSLSYRETLIHAFGECGIFGEGANAMTEDELTWNGPKVDIAPDPDRQLGAIRLTDDLSDLRDNRELGRLAVALGRMVSNPEYAREFGLISPYAADFRDMDISLPVIESIRIARRTGPNHQVTLDLVAEVTQCRIVSRNGFSFEFYGGSTILLDASGEVRFIISKNVNDDQRMAAQWSYMSRSGREFWDVNGHGRFSLNWKNLARGVCSRKMAEGKDDEG